MDRTQAAEIQRHMRRAANAINRASEIIFALDEEDREVLGTPLQEIIVALHFKLLHAVYIRYPELRPPDPGSGGDGLQCRRQTLSKRSSLSCISNSCTQFTSATRICGRLHPIDT